MENLKNIVGEWKIVKTNNSYHVFHDEKNIDAGNIVCYIANENDANANLISATPDLLKLVIEEFEELSKYKYEDLTDLGKSKYDRLKNVIEKATKK